MLISVYAWKGLWDLIDIGLEIDVLERIDQLDDYKIISLLITGVAGYVICFFLVFIQRFHMHKVLEEFIQVLAYSSVVMIWRTVWDGRFCKKIKNFYKAILSLMSSFKNFFFHKNSFFPVFRV